MNTRLRARHPAAEPAAPDLSAATGLDVIPPPWKHNPSAWRQRIPIAILATVAFVISVYLGLYQWRLIPGAWDPIWGPQTSAVLDSELSHEMSRWFRVPDAILGALAYLGDVVFALAGSSRRWQYRPWLVIIFGIDVIPLGIVSALLVFAQPAVVGAWCFLCLVTAFISLALVLLAYDEVYSTIVYLRRLWRRVEHKREFWRVFWGAPSQTAFEVGREFIEER